jgi:hypothetical protein
VCFLFFFYWRLGNSLRAELSPPEQFLKTGFRAHAIQYVIETEGFWDLLRFPILCSFLIKPKNSTMEPPAVAARKAKKKAR